MQGEAQRSRNAIMHRWPRPTTGSTRRCREWISNQPVFFVSTAPLDPQGSVNCSPKGNRDEFAVLDERTVAFLDQTGSGVETIAHLRENGRIVIMLCALGGFVSVPDLFINRT